ncbi:MAG TPA: hypothetical protein VI685_05525 [Candidatus Angelobacter sp.]
MRHPLRSRQQAWRYSLRALCLCLLGLATVPLTAQTVRPVVDENVVKGPGKKASGRIEYVNDSLQTLNVVLESRSFTVSDTGELSYRPLDSAIHVKFSESSFKIPPKQNYYVFYQAWADALPSWFVVYATFSGFAERTSEGLHLNILLPHTIYLLPKQGVRKDELVVKIAEYRPQDRKVVVRVENTGPAFGRVLQADVTSAKGKATSNGFPVFPHREREVEIPWEANDGPAKLVLHLEHFHLEHAVGSSSP